jgi:hypothetical protein
MLSVHPALLPDQHPSLHAQRIHQIEPFALGPRACNGLRHHLFGLTELAQL